MNRREFLLAAPGAAALYSAGCSDKAAAPLMREISVSLPEHISASPFYLAEERGYFREAGFQTRTVRLNVMQATPVLAGGKLDVAFGGVSAAVFNAVARGLRLRVVAGREYASPDCSESFTIYAHGGAFAGGPIEPRRLRGKRFSVRLRGITEFVLDVFLKQYGMSPDDVEKVDLPLSEALAALSANKIDALLDLELLQSPLAVSPQIVKLWRLAAVLPGHQYSFVLFGDSMLRLDVTVGARFLAAYLEGAREFLEGQTPKYMREFAAAHGLDVGKTVAACRNTFAKDGSIDMASIQRIMDWNFARKYSTQTMEAARVVDNGFIDEAHRLLASGRWRVSRNPRRAV